ncbi:MAG TPA: hypothetical protein DIW53_16895, partial [Achromobacter sp.]|nr:hypothetical protein [Achromobacter sp.]
MKRILSLSLLPILLAACSTPSEIPSGPGETSTIPGSRAPAADGPLVVPSLSALPDTPPRALAGKFKAGTWSEMPGWSADDLTQFWPLFLRNCRGLMRPTSGNLAAPARATPRAWQP